MQVETVYTFKNYLYIAHPVSSHKIKSPMYTRHCIYTFMLLATAVLCAISFERDQ